MVVRKRILVIDDDETVRKSCDRIFSTYGYDVETVALGREGLGRAVGGDIDLVMADLKLPDLDGMALVRSLRSQRPETVVIIITGYGTVPSAVEAIKLGVSDYVQKPFTPEQIRQAVGCALRDTDGEDEPQPKIQADLVRQVLRLAGRDQGFGQRLLTEGSRVLSGFPLGPGAKAAIVSGDIAWIEKRCGELSPEEREWLRRRLEAEVW